MAKSNPAVKTYISMENLVEEVASGPPRVEVSVQMHFFYKIIVDSLDLDLEEGTPKFLEAIKLYVFLGAMFECWANDFLRRYLKGHREAPPEIYDVMERQQLTDKIKVINKRVDGGWWKDGVPLIRKISEMRNRLVHFKDQPESADLKSLEVSISGGSFTGADLLNGIRDSVPNPRIYNDLVDQDLKLLRMEAMELFRELSALAPPLPQRY